MTTIFSGMNTALSALLAQQQAQQVTSHNVANANTPGYNRQEAILTTSSAYTRVAFNRPQTALQTGTGVTVASIQRFSLNFIDARYRGETSAAADWGQRQSILQQVEATLPEANGAGISDRLNQFWSAWQGLTSDPSNVAARATVVNTADALATMLHDRANSLTAIRRDQDANISATVADISMKGASVARLNQQIAAAIGAGDAPNDLLDQRDVLLNSLAESAGATTQIDKNGEALVSIGGHILVVGTQSQTLSVTPDPANPGLSKVVWADGNANITGGSLAGALKARDIDVMTSLNALNTLASSLITQVNAIHNTAYGQPPANVTNLDFFSGTNAQDIQVNPVIAANLDQLGVAAAPNSPGDSGKALAIAQLANSLGMSGGTRTMNGFWSDSIAQVGLDLQRATAESENHGTVRDSLEQQKESVGGVSLDEEAKKLIESQRAYEAAARMLTAFDQMADTIINRMGVVGL